MDHPIVRAKLRCTEDKERWWGFDNQFNPTTVHDYTFTVVTDGSEENKKFFAATPSGSLTLTTMKAGLYEVGKEYYLDFTPAN